MSCFESHLFILLRIYPPGFDLYKLCYGYCHISCYFNINICNVDIKNHLISVCLLFTVNELGNIYPSIIIPFLYDIQDYLYSALLWILNSSRIQRRSRTLRLFEYMIYTDVCIHIVNVKSICINNH